VRADVPEDVSVTGHALERLDPVTREASGSVPSSERSEAPRKTAIPPGAYAHRDAAKRALAEHAYGVGELHGAIYLAKLFGMTSDVHTSTPTRSGYVAIVGLPNAGKSTLLNRCVGEHLSIATAKPQTTWQQVMGILTEGATQIVFVDTPGLLEARDLLQRAMHTAAVEALAEADATLLVVDASRPPASADVDRIVSTLRSTRGPIHAAINQIDRAASDVIEAWERSVAALPGVRVHHISAREGTGVEELLDALRADMPEGPFLFPADEIASAPLRFFVAELVRETVFEQYHQEIPYSVFCDVAEFREEQDPVYIHVDVYVEKPSQKAILVGRKGAAIRELGSAARAKVEHLLGRRVYLDLWVKPLDAWRKSRAQLGRLGFRLPPDDQSRR
jgi:GTP-binding protein Era